MMSRSLGFRLYMSCIICEQPTEEHDPDCPMHRLAVLQAKVSKITCPQCHKGTVDINEGDWYECRKCHTQYSAGAIVPYKGKLPKAVLIDFDDNRAFDVLILPDKGHGKIRIDLQIKELGRIVRNAQRRAKRKQK